MKENGKSTDQSTVSRKDEFEHQELKILKEARKQLKADAMLVFLFHEVEEGLFITRFLEGKFKKKYVFYVFKGALDELADLRFGCNYGNSK